MPSTTPFRSDRARIRGSIPFAFSANTRSSLPKLRWFNWIQGEQSRAGRAALEMGADVNLNLQMAQDRGIYVEIQICAGVDEVWRHTQVPELHELWDLRFTSIDYLSKDSQEEPQRFRYSTRLGFGLKIDGEGESTGTREDATGLRTSALKFWSADPKSLIEDGSGYWQYIPTADGVRFLTWYNYQTRFGAAGRLIERLLFPRLIGS